MAKTAGFKNELTLDTLVGKKKEEEFHKGYEKAYAEALLRLGESYPNVIGGMDVLSGQGEFQDICPYATSEIVGNFQKGQEEDVVDAVRMAEYGQPAWEHTKVEKRCTIFQRAADIISKKKYDFAAWMTLENGKNRYESVAEVDEAIDYLRYYSTVLLNNRGYVLETDGAVPCNETRSVLRPLGVIGVISPFNFPLAITCGMTTGALITGNAVVLKPASDTPLMGYKLFRTLIEAGVPPEVLHFITGSGGTVGAELIANPGITSIAFTGSRDVGWNIAKSSAETGKRAPILEMGGKNPAIVTESADLDLAAEGICRSAFGYAGQKCSATSRVIVAKKVEEEFLKRVVAWLRDTKVGDPSKRETFIGPVINEAAVEKFEKSILMAAKDGQVLVGGHVLEREPFMKGHFVEPTIVTHLPKDHELVKKELFVPILAVIACDDFDDALETANSVEYGLTAAMYSEDTKEIEHFFDKIRAGVTYVNRRAGATTGSLVGVQSFTGWKASGVTGKGAGGPYYLMQFLQEQARTLCK